MYLQFATQLYSCTDPWPPPLDYGIHALCGCFYLPDFKGNSNKAWVNTTFSSFSALFTLPRHSQNDNIWSPGWPQGRRATNVRNLHRLTDNIDVILEAHCIDAFSLYWHGRLQNPFIGRRIITLSLICGQLPIGSSSNDIQLFLVASSSKGTDMDKEGCSLQGQRAQESVCCSDC